MLRYILLIKMILCLTFALAACGGETTGTATGNANSSDDGLTEVVYTNSKWYGHAPAWVGIKQGIFKKAGFKLVPKSFGGSSDRINALENNNAHFGSLGQTAALIAMAEGRDKFYWIGSQNNAPGNEGLVAVGIDDIDDLEGKTIALPERTSVHITVAQLLDEAGIDINDPDEIRITHVTEAEVVSLVAGGDVAAGAVWEPFYTSLRNIPDANVLGMDTDTDIYKKFGTMTGPDVICASRSWVEEDPARAKRLFKAYFEAVQWCADHPKEVIDIVAAEVGNATPREQVEAALKNFTWLGWQAQRLTMSEARLLGQAEEVCEVLKEIGLIKDMPKYANWTYPDVFME